MLCRLNRDIKHDVKPAWKSYSVSSKDTSVICTNATTDHKAGGDRPRTNSIIVFCVTANVTLISLSFHWNVNIPQKQSVPLNASV